MTITTGGQQKNSYSWPFQPWANHGNIPVGQQRKDTVGPAAEFHLLTIPTLGQQRKSSSGLGQQQNSTSWLFRYSANRGILPASQQMKHTVGPTAEFHQLTIPMLGQLSKSSSRPTEETHCWPNSRIALVDHSNIGPIEESSSGPTDKTCCWANSRIQPVDYSDIQPTE